MQLSADDLHVDIKKDSILKGIDCLFKSGKITAIIGANGCGKSTLVKTLSRLITPSRGDVFILDKKINTLKPKDIAKELGVLPQGGNLDEDVDVWELVSLGRYPYQGVFSSYSDEDFKVIEECLQIVGLLEFKDKKVSTLSGGQRQRCFIAMVLAQQTDILLLDEPTTYLDWSYQIEILSLMNRCAKDYNKTVVCVLHDINHVLSCADYVIGLKNGKAIFNGSVGEVINKDNLKELFGVEVQFFRDKQTSKIVCYSIL